MVPDAKCGAAAVSSWLEFLKEMILVREMRKHFHYGSQYRKEVAEVTREGASSIFLLDISIQTIRDERVHGTFLPPLAD